MGGIEFLGELRRDPDLRRTIVFVMTTSTADEDRTMAYDLNVNGYVLKYRPGQTFLEAISMLEAYWRVVVFPD
jgi:CheY-like chemotaxis protein